MLKNLRLLIHHSSLFVYVCVSPLIPSCIHSVFIHYFILYLRTLCNVSVHIHGDQKLLAEKNIFMANHYEGVDNYVLYPMIKQPLSNKLHLIGKDDMLGKHYPMGSFNSVMDYLIKFFYESGYIIPYRRGNKESGLRVRHKVKELLNNNEKLLIFPEGRSWRKGACHEFKPGMFEVAEQCNKSIVPITLKYRNFDGKNKGEKCVIQDWMDIEVDVFIHDEVLPKNYENMLEETFEKITSKN